MESNLSFFFKASEFHVMLRKVFLLEEYRKFMFSCSYSMLCLCVCVFKSLGHLIFVLIQEMKEFQVNFSRRRLMSYLSTVWVTPMPWFLYYSHFYLNLCLDSISFHWFVHLFPSQDFNRHCKEEEGKWKSTMKYFQIEWHGISEFGERFLVGIVRKNLMERGAFKTKLEWWQH